MQVTELTHALNHYLPELTSDELVRYGRHLTLAEVGPAGQRQIKDSRVLLVGAGGLGSPAALYLAAAGVGTLGLVDFDAVDLSNLQRQIIHGTTDIGRPKLDSASDRLRDINPEVHLERYDVALKSHNALEIARDYDVIVDGTDNFPTRYLVNDTCVLLGKPNAFGSVLRFEGQASVFATPDGPCYRCLFREPPPPGLVPSCAEAGVLGVLPGLIGTIQATETIKLLLGAGESLAGRLLLVDALGMRFRTIQVRRDPECPACGTRELRELIDYEAFCGLPSNGDDAFAEKGIIEISPRTLAERLARGDDIQLLDVREDWEWQIARIPEARLIPLPSLEGALETLDRARETVVYCKAGTRGLRAAEQLAAAGFDRVANMKGGILAWSEEVDPLVLRY
ncbi:MAG: molybdopterin-synthase adenylyltransferase MoeB [Gemmatimonadaceae bacterium]|nr:molybdopterin-synthase adenylyltransferase MoeB [Gemmatimonadaceae bacterium]